MALPVISEDQAELIKSLSQDEIPAKLRCAICSKLAVNAFRLPCCEQAICETCQSSLPSSCPVCEHSPLSADDCKPNKALRTTIRVFLRTEEKKRELNRPVDASPITPVDPSPLSIAPPVTAELGGSALAPQDIPSTETPAANGPSTEGAPATESTEVVNGQENGAPVGDQSGNETAADPTSQQAEASQNGTEAVAEPGTETSLVVAQADGDLETAGSTKEEDGADGEAAPNAEAPAGTGSFAAGGMGFGVGGFEQMQMMMMQNGMAPNGFGNFPMMGMPGMNMDPMTMQMYMNGGVQGMGMNGMNMNMGMGGYGGEANNNWNGQQSWNVGPDNFNHPNASGMGNGDFGSFNSGFQTGFNSGNYGHQNFNDYRGRNQYGGGFRGRGRGRGGYGYGYGQQGRGGNFHQGYGVGNFQDQNYAAQQQYHNGMNGHMLNGQGGTAGLAEQQDPSEETPNANADANVDEFGRSLRVDNEKDGADGDAAQGETSQDADGQTNRGDSDNAAGDASIDPDTGAMPLHGAQIGSDVQVLVGQDSFFAGANGISGDGNGMMFNQPAPDVPLNAPKGPKAMMWGLPNTSYKHLQARGWVDTSNKAATPTSADGMGYPSPLIDQGGRSRSRSIGSRGRHSERHPDNHRKRSKDRDAEKDRGYENDYGRDQERDRRDHHERSHSTASGRGRDHDAYKESSSHRRSRRARSRSVADGDGEDEHHRHRRHDRRKHSYVDDNRDAKSRSGHDDLPQAPADGEERSRSASPVADDSRRSGHRSSRKERSDRDSDKRRDREKDYDDHKGHKSSRRSHRDRDYERSDRDRDREKDRSTRDRDRDREKDKARDRDGDRDHNRDRKDRTRDRDRRDRDRDRDRDKDRGDRDRERRDRDHRHRSSKKPSGTDDPPATENSEGGMNPPSGALPKVASGRGGLEIKGAGTKSDSGGRRSSQASTGPTALDPHAAERAARDRERLLKETRRMAMMAATSTGGKRARGEDGDGESRRASSRRKGRRGEVVSIDDEEERMRRLEAEREAARFD